MLVKSFFLVLATPFAPPLAFLASLLTLASLWVSFSSLLHQRRYLTSVNGIFPASASGGSSFVSSPDKVYFQAGNIIFQVLCTLQHCLACLIFIYAFFISFNIAVLINIGNSLVFLTLCFNRLWWFNSQWLCTFNFFFRLLLINRGGILLLLGVLANGLYLLHFANVSRV